MKLFQFFVTPCFRKQVSFSVKAFKTDSFYVLNSIGKGFVYTRLFKKQFTPAYLLSVSKFHTAPSMWMDNDQNSPASKKRYQRKKSHKWKDNLNGKTLSVVAYSSAEEYRMQLLLRAIENEDLYKCLPLPEDAENSLHLCFKEESNDPPSHIYIFSEGSVVFWNVPKSQQTEMLSFLKPYEINSYDPEVVNDEKEDLDYTYAEEETCLNDGCIILNSKNSSELYTYTFSNSLAQSVKLGIFEEALEKYSNSLEWVTDEMKKGETIKMSRKDILAKRGELFSLRHAINLTSDLLDTPDFYWDRKDLEILYHQTCNYLDIAKRTRTMNVRLSYCSELVDLLVNHMIDEHHVRLEWMIIILIMVEVVFECLHFLEKFSH